MIKGDLKWQMGGRELVEGVRMLLTSRNMAVPFVFFRVRAPQKQGEELSRRGGQLKSLRPRTQVRPQTLLADRRIPKPS